jgi:phage terminase small subunit
MKRRFGGPRLALSAVPQVNPADVLGPVPGLLSAGAEAVWRELAPYAAEARTLTPGTAFDFAQLCEMVVEARDALQARRAEGWTADGTRIATSWRGIVQRLEAKMRGFRLSPIGREIAAPVPQAVDPFAEFDQPAV